LGFMIKAVIIFLVIMVALALMGRLRWPKARAAFCPACGRPKVGTGPCPCGKG
jgi:uncharacterized membrane protein YhhN